MYFLSYVKTYKIIVMVTISLISRALELDIDLMRISEFIDTIPDYHPVGNDNLRVWAYNDPFDDPINEIHHDRLLRYVMMRNARWNIFIEEPRIEPLTYPNISNHIDYAANCSAAAA